MSDPVFVSRVEEGRARVTLLNQSGGKAAAIPMVVDRKRVIVKGLTSGVGNKSEVDREAEGFLIALPIMEGSVPLVSLTLANGDEQVSLVVDPTGLSLILKHIVEALKMVVSELQQGKDEA